MSDSSFRSPFAALVWKEWRESWWLLILMVVGPAALTILPVLSPASHFAVDMLAVFCFYGLALSLAAGLFASERARGTEAFQHERPVERGTIWNAKLLLPMLALISGAILFGIVALWLNPLEQWRPLGIVAPCIVIVSWFLSFISAVLCSVLLDRPLTAGAAGGVLSVASFLGLAGLFGLYSHLTDSMPTPHTALVLILCLLVIEAIGLLWLSRVAYVRWKHD